MRSMFRNSNRSEERGVKAAHSSVSTEIRSSITHLKTNHFLSQGAVATCHLTLLNIIQEMSAVITDRWADEGWMTPTVFCQITAAQIMRNRGGSHGFRR